MSDLTQKHTSHQWGTASVAAPLQATIATISACQQERGITEVSLLNFVVSDGVNMIATRYVSHQSESAASLYYAEGSAFQREGQGAGERPQSATPAAASNAASARDTAVTGACAS